MNDSVSCQQVAMGDKRPAPPLPLENKLLKSLSASVAASSGRRDADGSRPPPPPAHPGGPFVRPPHLQNTLLAQLSARASALTSTRSSLPLRSSVLAKYETEHRPLPPPPPAAAPAPVRCPAAQPVPLLKCDELESSMGFLEDYEDDEDDIRSDEEDISYAISCDAPGRGRGLLRKLKTTAFAQQQQSVSFRGPKSRKMMQPMRGMIRGLGGGFGSSLFGAESWAEPEPQYDFKGVSLGSEFDDRPTWTSPEQSERPELERARAAKVRR